MLDLNNIETLNSELQHAEPVHVFQMLCREYENKIVFSSSLGAEDQIITHMIAQSGSAIRIFTIDTGRLFYETYDLLERTKSKYQIPIEIYFPDAAEVEEMVNKKGANLFYESIENRKLCCSIRKINPLKRALKGAKVWITGIRKEQSVTRTDMQMFEWDKNHDILKYNPLINWTEEEVWKYIRKNKIPYNILHDKGYLSIGCAPCTRAIEKGEPSRNGRWWWENPETRECGLHLRVKTN